MLGETNVAAQGNMQAKFAHGGTNVAMQRPIHHKHTAPHHGPRFADAFQRAAAEEEDVRLPPLAAC
jgi:hypothetical protein